VKIGSIKAPREGLRSRIAALDFVNAKRDGTLDLWSPPRSGDARELCERGRHCAAGWVKVMRESGFPGQIVHLFDAYRAELVLPGPALAGLLYEFGKIIQASPKTGPLRQVSAGERGRGETFGALMCESVRMTRWPMFLAAFPPPGVVSDTFAAAAMTHVGEVLIAAPVNATTYLEGAYGAE